MNQLLFERSTGNVGCNTFERIHTHELLASFRAAPHLRFDGGERGTAIHRDSIAEASGPTQPHRRNAVAPATPQHIWAHQAGVNSLALERFEGRM